MNSQNERANIDNLDLFYILRKFQGIYKRRKKVIYMALISGLILSLAYYLLADKVYKSRIILSTSYLKASSFVILIDDLQRHILDKNTSELAASLNLSEEEVKKIKKLQVSSARHFAQQEFGDKITAQEVSKDADDNEYVIEAYVNDKALFPKLEYGIVHYLETNGFIREKSKQNKANLKIKAEKISQQIRELDSLKYTMNNMYSQPERKGNGGNIVLNDPSLIYSHVLELYESELLTRAELNKPDISIIQRFIPHRKAHSPKLFICLFLGLFFSMVIASFYILYLEISEHSSI